MCRRACRVVRARLIVVLVRRRLSRDALTSMTVATTMWNILWMAITGAGGTMDCLGTQAHGSGDARAVKSWALLTTAFLLLCCLPATAVMAAAAVETVLGSRRSSMSGMEVARTVAACLGEGSQFFLGSSSVVRHVGSFAGRSLTEVEVLGNRGTSGIDGCVSTAWGAALGFQSLGGGPSLALVGDEAFWYDSNALGVPATDGWSKVAAR